MTRAIFAIILAFGASLRIFAVPMATQPWVTNRIDAAKSDMAAEVAAATNALEQSQAEKIAAALRDGTNYAATATAKLREDLEEGRQSVSIANNAHQASSLKDWNSGRSKSAGEIFAQIENAGLTTNDVCAIVTNEVAVGWGEWVLAIPDELTGEGLEYWRQTVHDATISGHVSIGGNQIWIGEMNATSEQDVSQDGTELRFNGAGWGGLSTYLGLYEGDVIATRTHITRNALGLARLSDLPPLTNGLIGADFISTNNAAFVSAVTNCPVVIAAGDAEALTEWGIYGGGGTIGALLAALAAAVAALKRGKVTTISAQSTDEQYPSAKCVYDALEQKAELVTSTPPVMDGVEDIGVMTVAARADHRHPSDTSKQDRYPFIAATVAGGSLTLQDAKVQTWTPSAGASATIVAAAYVTGAPARDAVLVIDCSLLSEGDEPTVTWDTHFHPRTDAGTDFACVAGVRNVYYISEYAQGEFAVGGWTETAGGNA